MVIYKYRWSIFSNASILKTCYPQIQLGVKIFTDYWKSVEDERKYNEKHSCQADWFDEKFHENNGRNEENYGWTRDENDGSEGDNGRREADNGVQEDRSGLS